MAVPQISAEGSQHKAQCIDAKNIPNLQMLAETPNKKPRNETQCAHCSTVVNETSHWVGPKNREWRQYRRSMMNSMAAP